MIKIVIFDLGGVLFTNGTKRFIKIISDRYNIPIEKIKNVLDSGVGTLYREGKMKRDEFWKQVTTQLPLTEDIDVLEDEWISNYTLISGTQDIIFQLTQKNYKVYYLSDNVKERIEKIDIRYPFLQWFTGGVFSHEVGVRKPHPKIYQIILKKAQVQPHEAVFIDDKQEMVEAAQKLGMHAIIFTDPETLHAALINLGVF